MQNKLPKLFDKHKICVICEGNEEYEYHERLKALKVWDAQYEIISDNAGGNGNIPARYQDSYQNGSYELVLVFCDTEKKPYEQYEEFTGVPNYKGRKDQIETVMEHITAENYAHMRERVCKLETQDTVTGSSNFGRFMELFESSDAKWIDKINEVLEG